jgi:hypothetical protein
VRSGKYRGGGAEDVAAIKPSGSCVIGSVAAILSHGSLSLAAEKEPLPSISNRV